MKAIKELGFKKTVKYFFFTFWEIAFPCMIFSPMRVLWMQLFGVKIGKNSTVGKIHFLNLHRRGLAGLVIGKDCYIGNDVVLDLADRVSLGDNVTLADGVFVLTHTNVGYKTHPLQKFFPAFTKPVVFQNGGFVGIRTTVMPGVTVGEDSAVGACSLVKKDIPSHELHYGIPAVFKRELI